MARQHMPAWTGPYLDRHWPSGMPRPSVTFDDRVLKTKLAHIKYLGRAFGDSGQGTRSAIVVYGAGTRTDDEQRGSFLHEIAHAQTYMQGFRFEHHGVNFRRNLCAIEHLEGRPHDRRYEEGCREGCTRTAQTVQGAVAGWAVASGQAISFLHPRLGMLRGRVVRRGPRNATVEAWQFAETVDKQSFRVPYHLLRAETVVDMPAPITTAGALTEDPGCVVPHHWRVDREYDFSTSASGKAVYSRRDQTCTRCGKAEQGRKWSRTVTK